MTQLDTPAPRAWTATTRAGGARARSGAPADTPRLHASDALAVAGWLAFVVLWLRTLSYTRAATLSTIGLLIAVALVVVLGATALWIRHNLAIYRRKGPRRAVPPVDATFERDAIGRVLVADWDEVRTSAYVLVDPGQERKTLTACTPTLVAQHAGLTRPAPDLARA